MYYCSVGVDSSRVPKRPGTMMARIASVCRRMNLSKLAANVIRCVAGFLIASKFTVMAQGE